jgi:hypothetical protein
VRFLTVGEHRPDQRAPDSCDRAQALIGVPEGRRHEGDVAQTVPRSTCDHDITCQALELALVATHMRVAWHAGLINAETAMSCVDRAVNEILRSRVGRPRSS